MTQEAFNQTRFGKGDKAVYHDKVCDVVQVDFEERLLAIDFFDDRENLSWVRCESIVFVSANA